MPICRARLQAELVIGLAEAAGVRQLEADDQVLCVSEPARVCRNQVLPEFRKFHLVRLIDDELIWIGPSIGTHGHGLAAQNQLRAAFAEPAPTPNDFFSDTAGGGPVPAFHRLDGIASAYSLAIDCDVLDGL